jgi:hypothetical protein
MNSAESPPAQSEAQKDVGRGTAAALIRPGDFVLRLANQGDFVWGVVSLSAIPGISKIHDQKAAGGDGLMPTLHRRTIASVNLLLTMNRQHQIQARGRRGLWPEGAK